MLTALITVSCNADTRDLTDQSASATQARGAARDTITLITGDRVTLGRDGAPRVTPGPGREHTSFAITRRRGELIVIPGDVVGAIAAGQLDRALFNVSRLLAAGLGDDRRSDLPLIVTGTAPVAAQHVRFAAAGVAVARELPSLHGLAIHPAKATAAALLAELATERAGLARGARPATRIQLDRPYRAVARPAAPATSPTPSGPRASADATGAGVVVAVLDTGIDERHPDLAGKVIASSAFVQFSDDPLDPTDRIGNGTMVASIIAGTGAASGGQYRGVAPDAQLLNGRICNEFGECFGSDIVAAMDWAVVDHGARIVYLGLAGPARDLDDPDDVDPVVAELTTLSSRYGALFVTVSGDGGGAQSISSPGNAPAALTVGAVDVAGQLAAFSGQGPTLGDTRIKPDLTAPGVDIVGARASGVDLEQLGTPVGDQYVQRSSTGVASPYAAGAAALLLQQHPDWTGADLKAQLVGSAAPAPGLLAFQQGAGQLDLERALHQPVHAVPSDLSFGVIRWPHTDDPVLTRVVRYHNTGASPITLALAASLSLPDHTPAPPGLFRLDRDQLVIAAGDTGELTVTIDTNGDGPVGSFSGALVATSGDGTRVETAVEVNRERESYDVTFHVLDHDGGSSVDANTAVISPGFVAAGFSAAGTEDLTLRVPRGTYTVQSLDFEHLSPASPVDLQVVPRLEVTRDQALVLDGQRTKRADVQVSGLALGTLAEAWGYVDRGTGAEVFLLGGPISTASLGPDAPIDQAIGFGYVNRVRLDDSVDQPADIYELARQTPGRLPTGWTETIDPAHFATVHMQASGSAGETLDNNVTPAIGLAGTIVAVPYFGYNSIYDAPATRTEHVFGPKLAWIHVLDDLPVSNGPGGNFGVLSAQALATYESGLRYDESWNHAVFGPAFPEQLQRVPDSLALYHLAPSAARTGDTLTLTPSLFSDAAGRKTISDVGSQRLALYADDALVSEQFDGAELPPIAVSPRPAHYRLEATARRSEDELELSTRLSAVWTFDSRHAAATDVLALPVLRFHPALDDHNRAVPGLIALPIAIERPAGAAAAPVTAVSLEVSFDDGVTWTAVPVVRLGDRALAMFAQPATARYVSLRGSAGAADGSRVDQTIVRAYAIAAP